MTISVPASRMRKGKGKANQSRRTKKPQIDPITEQALANGAQLGRGTFEVQQVPNPHGEVVKAGQPIIHRAVKRIPQFELLYRRHVISRQAFAALTWYADRLALSESGMISNPLASNGGGATGVGIPISQARLDAGRDVDWSRRAVGAHKIGGGPSDVIKCNAMLEIFDAVMAEEVTFVDAARREAANRYVRISVRRRQDELRDLFVDAARRLLEAHAKRFPQGPRKIVVSNSEGDGK